MAKTAVRSAARGKSKTRGKAKVKAIKVKTIPWNVTEHLKSEEDIANYLEAAFEEGDPSLVAAALGDVARAKGMSKVAEAAGLGRESLYKALSSEGNPELATVLKVVQALGLRLKVAV